MIRENWITDNVEKKCEKTYWKIRRGFRRICVCLILF